MLTPPPQIGSSPHFLSMLDHISRIAAVHRPVLIMGERGTGKELAAARLHYLSKQWDGPYITLNCAALSPSLLDAELFGAEQGSYTGATKTRVGRFERANGGTLFLDEIGTASLEVQEKLLRAIEYGQYERVGGGFTKQAHVRIIAATKENLTKAVEESIFRADLLDRLSFDIIHVPPLRLRQEDIFLLSEHFMTEIAAELGWSSRPSLAHDALQDLKAYHWPGNIRELKNVCERAIAHAVPDTKINMIKLAVMTPPWLQNPMTKQPKTQITAHVGNYNFKARLDETARQWLKTALESHDGNQTETAKSLDLNYFQLRHLLSKHNILPEKPDRNT